jgi:hypothetical protein
MLDHLPDYDHDEPDYIHEHDDPDY